MTRYRVGQDFETLGAPVSQEFATRQEAEEAAHVAKAAVVIEDLEEEEREVTPVFAKAKGVFGYLR